MLDTKSVPKLYSKVPFILKKAEGGQPKTTFKEGPEKGQKSSNPRTFLVPPAFSGRNYDFDAVLELFSA